MAPHSSTLAWKIPWAEEPGRLQSMGSRKSDTTERLHFHFSVSCIGEGNGNPLQCSCLENPRDGGVWWSAVSGVAQSWTRLKRLSSSNNEPITTIFQSILKSRDVILPTKVCLVKAMVFPVVIYGCESWTIKRAEKLMPLNFGAGEDSWESLGQQGDQIS